MDAKRKAVADRWVAYSASVVTLVLPTGTVTLTVGAPPPPHVPTPGGVITADNPGYTQSNALNERARWELHALLHRRQLWHAPTLSAASDETHREAGFYVMGVTLCEVVALGRAFGQEAVYWLSSGSLDLHPCDQPIPYKNPSREPT